MLGIQINQFLESLKVQNYSLNSIKSYSERLKSFVGFLNQNGVSDFLKVTPQTIQSYQRFLETKNISLFSVHSYLGTVRFFFKYLETIHLIISNPCHSLILPRIKDHSPKPILTMEEIQRLFKPLTDHTPSGIRNRSILEIFYSTGIRLGEMTRLTIDDIDLKNGLLIINQGKGSKDRMVPLGVDTIKSIHRYLKEIRMKWGREYPLEKSLWLSVRIPHPPLKFLQIRLIVKKEFQKVGIHKNITPHVLRHTISSHMSSHGMDLDLIRQMLGHQSISTTQNYLRVSLEELQQSHSQSHPSERRIK